MNIWILNHHALTPDMSGGTRHYDFAKELVSRGHKVTIIASSFHYSKYKEMKEYKSTNYLLENIDGIDFIWFKTPPYKGNGISRVLNMLSYSYKACSIIPKLNLEKPDIILGSSVHLFAVFSAYKLSKKYKTPFIMEVRDLWPKTLIDMGISKWHPFILLLGWLEKYLYKKADKIITLLPKAHTYIEKLGIDRSKIVWISNGTSMKSTNLESDILNKKLFNILYTGTHGVANDLSILIEVAKKLKDNNLFHFTLLGDGPEKSSLEIKAKQYKLNNITFLSSVPKTEVSSYLNSADLLYVGLKDLPLYRYGMSMNKVFDYMNSKKPILFVSSIKDNVVDVAGCGKVVKNYSVEDVSDSIIKFSKMPSQKLDEYGLNGYNYLQQNFSIFILVDKLEDMMNKVVKDKNV